MRPVLPVKNHICPDQRLILTAFRARHCPLFHRAFQPGFFNPAGALYGWRGDKHRFLVPVCCLAGSCQRQRVALGASRCRISVHLVCQNKLDRSGCKPRRAVCSNDGDVSTRKCFLHDRIPGEAALGIDLFSQFWGVADHGCQTVFGKCLSHFYRWLHYQRRCWGVVNRISQCVQDDFRLPDLG